MNENKQNKPCQGYAQCVAVAEPGKEFCKVHETNPGYRASTMGRWAAGSPPPWKKTRQPSAWGV